MTFERLREYEKKVVNKDDILNQFESEAKSEFSENIISFLGDDLLKKDEFERYIQKSAITVEKIDLLTNAVKTKTDNAISQLKNLFQKQPINEKEIVANCVAMNPWLNAQIFLQFQRTMKEKNDKELPLIEVEDITAALVENMQRRKDLEPATLETMYEFFGVWAGEIPEILEEKYGISKKDAIFLTRYVSAPNFCCLEEKKDKLNIAFNQGYSETVLKILGQINEDKVSKKGIFLGIQQKEIQTYWKKLHELKNTSNNDNYQKILNGLFAHGCDLHFVVTSPERFNIGNIIDVVATATELSGADAYSNIQTSLQAYSLDNLFQCQVRIEALLKNKEIAKDRKDKVEKFQGAIKKTYMEKGKALKFNLNIFNIDNRFSPEVKSLLMGNRPGLLETPEGMPFFQSSKEEKLPSYMMNRFILDNEPWKRFFLKNNKALHTLPVDIFKGMQVLDSAELFCINEAPEIKYDAQAQKMRWEQKFSFSNILSGTIVCDIKGKDGNIFISDIFFEDLVCLDKKQFLLKLPELFKIYEAELNKKQAVNDLPQKELIATEIKEVEVLKKDTDSVCKELSARSRSLRTTMEKVSQEFKELSAQWYDDVERLKTVQEKLEKVNACISELAYLNTRYAQLLPADQEKITKLADWKKFNNTWHTNLLNHKKSLKSRLNKVNTMLHSPLINDARVETFKHRIQQLDTMHGSPLPNSSAALKALALTPAVLLQQCKAKLDALPGILKTLHQDMSMLSAHERVELLEKLGGYGSLFDFLEKKGIETVTKVQRIRNKYLSETLSKAQAINVTAKSNEINGLLKSWGVGKAKNDDLVILEKVLNEIRQYNPNDRKILLSHFDKKNQGKIRLFLDSTDLNKDYQKYVESLLRKELAQANALKEELNATTTLHNITGQSQEAFDAIHLLRKRGYITPIKSNNPQITYEEEGSYHFNIEKIENTEKKSKRICALNSQLSNKQQVQFKNQINSLTSSLSDFEKKTPLKRRELRDRIKHLDAINTHRANTQMFRALMWVTAPLFFLGVPFIFAALATKEEVAQKNAQKTFLQPLVAELQALKNKTTVDLMNLKTVEQCNQQRKSLQGTEQSLNALETRLNQLSMDERNVFCEGAFGATSIDDQYLTREFASLRNTIKIHKEILEQKEQLLQTELSANSLQNSDQQENNVKKKAIENFSSEMTNQFAVLAPRNPDAQKKHAELSEKLQVLLEEGEQYGDQEQRQKILEQYETAGEECLKQLSLLSKARKEELDKKQTVLLKDEHSNRNSFFSAELQIQKTELHGKQYWTLGQMRVLLEETEGSNLVDARRVIVTPVIREHGRWQSAAWPTGENEAVNRLKKEIEKHYSSQGYNVRYTGEEQNILIPAFKK